MLMCPSCTPKEDNRWRNDQGCNAAMREALFGKPRREGMSKWLLCLVLLLAFYLRLTGLDAKSLWQDEIFTAAIAARDNSISEVISIPLYNTALPAPPLYFLISHFFFYIGDNDFLLRFPALLFGVLGVSITYTLGARLFGGGEGLVGAFLLSLSSLHIRYSQDARFYSLLVLLSLFSVYFLYRALCEGSTRWWMGFTACTILNIYNHLFALLVLLSQAVFVGGLWTKRLVQERWRYPTNSHTAKPAKQGDGALDRRKAFAFLISLAIILLFYAPMIPHLLRGLAGRKGLGGEATPGISSAPSFLSQLLEAWGSGRGLVLLVFLIPFVVGIIGSVRTHRRQLWLAFCWLVIPFMVLVIVPAEHGFRPRYVLFMLPLYLLLIARGLVAINGVLDKWLERRRSQPRSVFMALALLVFVLANFPALRVYYNEGRSDWRAVAALLERSFSAGEVIVSPGPFPQVVLPRYNQDLKDATFLIGGSEILLSQGQDAQKGVWFIGPGREKMNSIEQDLREAMPSFYKVVFDVDADTTSRGVRLSIAPTMYGDLWILYVRDGLDSKEVIERYEEAVEVVPPTVASSIHTTLGDLYLEQRELDEAVAHYQQAIILSPMAPEPHRGLAELYQNRGMEAEAAAEWGIYERLLGEK